MMCVAGGLMRWAAATVVAWVLVTAVMAPAWAEVPARAVAVHEQLRQSGARAGAGPGAEKPAAAKLRRGIASWYGDAFHGRRTASGERYDMHEFTAAHPTLPFGTVVEVRSLVNGRTVRVRINDRGPYGGRRVIDLSRAAAQALDLLERGTKRVQLRPLAPDELEMPLTSARPALAPQASVPPNEDEPMPLR